MISLRNTNMYETTKKNIQPKPISRNHRMRSGQVMLLTVLVLSATLLSVTAIAGLLTFYQIKQATNVKNSVKAIYAAETGIELELYRWEKDRSDCHGAPLPSAPVGLSQWSPGEGDYPASADCYPASVFENGATFDTRITYGLDANGETRLVSVKSTGQSGSAARALQVQF